MIVRPHVFASRVWLVDRPLQNWWHRALLLVPEHVGAVSCWIFQLAFEENMKQNTGLLWIGYSLWLISLDGMREWRYVKITVHNVVELRDVINLEHVMYLRCSDVIDVSLIKNVYWCNRHDVSEIVWARWYNNEIYAS